jgi:hypothetical protein
MKAPRFTHPISIMPAGHGHNKITVTFRGNRYSTVTSNTRATDVVNDEQYAKDKDYSCARAHRQLLNEIKRNNNLR